jgi:hypothetical protein
MDVVPDDQSEHKVADRQEYQKREQEHHPPLIIAYPCWSVRTGHWLGVSFMPAAYVLSGSCWAWLFTVAQGL